MLNHVLLVLFVAVGAWCWPDHAVAQHDSGLGVVRFVFESGYPDYEFRPDRQPENRIRINRKGEERLLAGWRYDAAPGSADELRNAVVQVAAHADGRGRFGVMFAIERGREFRNYSAGCGPDSHRQCDPAALGLALDLDAGTLRLDQVLLTRDTLDDGPEANEQVTASGTLYFTGKPARP